VVVVTNQVAQHETAPVTMLVVDASVVLALVLPLPYSDKATAAIQQAVEKRDKIYAPALLEYEVCSVLRREAARKFIEEDEAMRALELINTLHIRPITPAWSLHVRALSWAQRLGQTKAYDAQYLALAEEMGCPLLTADVRLAHAAHALGANWVIGLE
jgi:predicted nucleic acid-binding protein